MGFAPAPYLPPKPVVGETLAHADRDAAPMTRRHGLGLGGIVLVALGLRAWALDQNGYGNEYYSAGVRSMLASWHNLFFNAFDPAGFVSLDKPPVAFWIQAASARLFGYSGPSLLLPQVVEGVAAILLLFHLVRRCFGAGAALLAALFLALTPVSVAVDRSTNTESCLVLVMLASALALVRAAERGSFGRLLLASAILGIGFNVKMLAALVVLPAFALVYALGAPIAWQRRLAHGLGAGAVLAVVALSWPLAFDLTPEEDRPFAGSSPSNSMLELALDHNGLQRFGRVGRRALADEPIAGDTDGAQLQTMTPGPRSRLENPPVGPLRLASPFLAGQIAWLLPLAVLGGIAAWPRERFRPPLSPGAQDVLLWAAWAASCAVVFSAAGGIFHGYYLAVMAPALAALAGIGALGLLRWRRLGGWRSTLLPATLVATAAWQYFIADGFPGAAERPWWPWLPLFLVAGTAAAVAALFVAPRAPRLAPLALGVGVAMLLVLPATWALSTVLIPARVEFPAAGIWQATAAEDPAVRAARARQIASLLLFLREEHRGERFLVATPDARRAAPLIIASGEPVMAMGGYMGGDMILTPAALAGMAARGELRFVMIAPEDQPGRSGRRDRNAGLVDWVRENGRPVDPSLWRIARDEAAADALRGTDRRRLPRSLAALELYDVAPETRASADGFPAARAIFASPLPR
jgi:4-amino-4-deoxy-L-arabinose transferase-like glycosyltransferase